MYVNGANGVNGVNGVNGREKMSPRKSCKAKPEFEIKLSDNVTVTPIRSWNAMRKARAEREREVKKWK